jgi:hypothetical protein
MLESTDVSSVERLDDRTAAEVMGWVTGGPDNEFWVLPEPPEGMASVFRMPVTRWRPTRDSFCRQLLVEELRSRGLIVEVEETRTAEGFEYLCTIAPSADDPPALSVRAPTAGLAVVCAALASAAGGV